MNKDKLTEMKKELFESLLKLETTTDCEQFFEDLCTFKEVEQMAQRVRAAKLLLEGKTYLKVIEDTEISSATLSRVSRCVRHGSGGYSKFVSFNKEKDKN